MNSLSRYKKYKSFWLALIVITILGSFQNMTLFGQANVFAGEDYSVCPGNNLLLADLNDSLTNISGDVWWETSGDGTFSSSILYNDATHYIPGSNDIANEQVTLTLYAREYNPNGPLYKDEVVLFIPGFVMLICNDVLSLSLDVNCEFEVKVDMLLEGEHPPLNLYTMVITDEDGNIVPDNIITVDYLDQTLEFTVGNECDLNTCGGVVLIEDKYPPVLYCDRDTITCLEAITPDSTGFPLDTSLIDTLIYLGDQHYYLEGWDACGGATLNYSDEIFSYSCDSSFQELIVRTWVAEDDHGNISSCADSLFVARVKIADLILPPNYNNIDSAALQYDGDWLALENGNPSPESTGFPQTERCSDIVYQYLDTRFESCGPTFDVYRDWSIMDWCLQELVHWGQIIKVMDTIAPVLTCVEDTIVIGADPYNCYSRTHQLDLPLVLFDSSNFTFEVKIYLFGDVNDAVNVTEYNGNYYVSQLPLGIHTVVYTATDECNNQSVCTNKIMVVDDVIPYAICDNHTQVSLGSNGIARLYATSVDDGSFDNCGIVYMEVIKMTDICGNGMDTLWSPYVDFCCDEVGDTVMVSFRVWDESGNYNICMVEVLIEDKVFPAIICPPDITVSCDFYYNPNNLDAYFGTVVTSELDREDIVINDYFNSGVVGQDGVAYDNCNVHLETTVEFDLNSCNVGTIYRTFTAVDDGGLKQPCLQRIFITDPDPFDEEDIIWPVDVATSGCLTFDVDTSVTGYPVVNDDACSLVAISYEDQLFTVVGDACEKVVRTWTIIDWCQFDFYTNKGQWTYKQVIMLYNTVGPQFTSDCSDRDICIYGSCKGLVELEASALDDCTDQEDLVWQWRLDRDDDGFFDDFGQGTSFAKVLGEGVYRINWTVEDKCGNETHCSYRFTVEDCKLPTPYCISSLTTVVMNNNGMVSITPEAFDIGSYDNCTNQEDLLLSWSPDVNDTLFTVTCDSLILGPERTFFLDMWVTDEAGNQDYCSIWLRVQDNNGVCGFSGGTNLLIAGNVFMPGTSIGLEQSTVSLKSSLTELDGTTTTNANGSYMFDQLAQGQDYEIAVLSPNNYCTAGVSTLDLVFIQRHILALNILDSPYKMLAADANNTNSISGADILEIRKLILGINSDFKTSSCWKYVPRAYIFDNPYMPWNYPEKISFDNLQQNQTNNDFYGVKTGDVNASYIPFLNGENIDIRNTYSLKLDDVQIEGGQVVSIPVYPGSDEAIMGLQFSLQYDLGQIEILTIEPGSIDLTQENFAFHKRGDNYLTFSWNAPQDIKLAPDKPLFYIKLKANNLVRVSESLHMNSAITKALVISNFEETGMNLAFRNSDFNSYSYKLYQNEPNPFDSYTSIGFEIPVTQDVKLQVFNTSGKLVYIYENKLEKGFHTIEISKNDISQNGIYYYTLKTADFVSTKKMIYLK